MWHYGAMASAMSTLVAVFLCMALVVVHVDSARLLLQAGNDTVGMTAQTTAIEDSTAHGTPPAAGEPAEFQAGPPSDTTTSDAIVFNDDALTADPTGPEFATLMFGLSKRASTGESADAETLVPPTDASFAQKNSVPPGSLYNLNDDFTAPFAAGSNRFSRSDADADSLASSGQGILVGDSARTLEPDARGSFALTDRGFLAADPQGAVGSRNYGYSYDATKRDAAYPADLNAGDSEFALAEANSRFGSESGNPSTPEEPEFEFADQDNAP